MRWIETAHSYKEYDKLYGKLYKKGKLHSYTSRSKLNDKCTYWYIGGKYYETSTIKKSHGLLIGIICGLSALVIAAAITIPLLLLKKRSN